MNSKPAVAASIRSAAAAARIGRVIPDRLSRAMRLAKLCLPVNQPRMLRAYGPNCDGSIIEAGKGQLIPDDATWIDLEEPTREEDKLVEQCVGVQVPTREDMVNGLGVLGWGVGGIEAEAAMLGQPVSMVATQRSR